MSRKIYYQSGMTLIEVLITIAIIGLLMAAMATGINSYLLRSDDATRKTDLKKIAIALDQYYNDHNGYPESLALTPGGRTCGNATVLTPYLKEVPCDPKGGTTQPYLYLPQGNSNIGSHGSEQVYRGYRLLAALSYAADPQVKEVGCPKTTGCGGIQSGIVANPKAYNFGVARNAQVNTY